MPTLSPSLVTQTHTFYAPTLRHTLKPSFVTRAHTFYAPDLTQVALPINARVGRPRSVALEQRLQAAASSSGFYRGRRQHAPEILHQRHHKDRRVGHAFNTSTPPAVLGATAQIAEGNTAAPPPTDDLAALGYFGEQYYSGLAGGF